MRTQSPIANGRADAGALLAAHRAIRQQTARFLAQLREFDLHRAYRRPRKGGATARSTAEWLRQTLGLAEDVAREQIGVAYALLNLPAIELAFENGELSYRKVRAAIRVANVANEAAVLAALGALTDEQAEDYCERLRQRRAPAMPAPAA